MEEIKLYLPKNELVYVNRVQTVRNQPSNKKHTLTEGFGIYGREIFFLTRINRRPTNIILKIGARNELDIEYRQEIELTSTHEIYIPPEFKPTQHSLYNVNANQIIKRDKGLRISSFNHSDNITRDISDLLKIMFGLTTTSQDEKRMKEIADKYSIKSNNDTFDVNQAYLKNAMIFFGL